MAWFSWHWPAEIGFGLCGASFTGLTCQDTSRTDQWHRLRLEIPVRAATPLFVA